MSSHTKNNFGDVEQSNSNLHIESENSRHHNGYLFMLRHLLETEHSFNVNTEHEEAFRRDWENGNISGINRLLELQKDLQ